MPDARERAKARHERRMNAHIGRIKAADDPKRKLMAAWGLFLAAWTNCKNPAERDRLGRKVLAFLIDTTNEFPRENP